MIITIIDKFIIVIYTGYRGYSHKLHQERDFMPLYLDIHHKIEGLTAEKAAQAHAADVAIQGKYKVNYLKYWFDETTGRAFCLVEAPNKEAAIAVHREAHGEVADEIIEVTEGVDIPHG
jgi:hypothetical protein